MADRYRFILDENTEFKALAESLSNDGHDVKTLKTASGIDLGALDTDIAAYSRTTRRAIITYDDDFKQHTETPIAPTDTAGIFFIEDDRLSPAQITYIIDSMTNYIAPSDFDQTLVYVSRKWLSFR